MSSILQEKKNCWKIAPVTRGGFLIDAAAYFKNLYHAMLEAEESIFIIGWDIDTRTKLIHQPIHADIPTEFGAFLSYLIRQKKDLHIYILIWDYYSILAFERELFVKLKLGWMSAKRIQFHLDSEFPMGASHHQKIVVIDDQIAFCGGIDITSERWDTSKHRKRHHLRKTHYGTEYEPQHDLQMMVEGEAASWMGKLARTRWERATGIKIPQKKELSNQQRFDHLDWDFQEAHVGISRTEPGYKHHRRVREIEQLFIDLIQNTQRHLYIENQYFTSDIIFETLRESLSMKAGPEITLILPSKSPYEVENYTMGAIQAIHIKKLKESDPYGRLGIFSPIFKNDEEKIIKLHSKVMICDDHYARIGSANMSNRSLGLDTECDITLDGSQNLDLREAIEGLKTTLLSEHLQDSRPEIQKHLRKKTSINQFIRSHARKHRYLQETSLKEANETILTQSELTDLQGPLVIDRMLDFFGGKKTSLSMLRSAPFIIGTFLGVLMLLMVAGSVLPWYEEENLRNVFLKFQQHPLQAVWIGGIYIISGILFVPLNLLILATASMFSGTTAFMYALLGSLLNAAATYGVGMLIGKRTIQKYLFQQVQKIAKKMESKGLPSIIFIRLLPIAPYSAINFIAGAFKISFKKYLLGTALGITPGIIVFIFFQRSLLGILVDPHWTNITVFSAIIIGICILMYHLKKRLSI